MLLLDAPASPLFQDTSLQRWLKKRCQKKLSSGDPGLGCLVFVNACSRLIEHNHESRLSSDHNPFKIFVWPKLSQNLGCRGSLSVDGGGLFLSWTQQMSWWNECWRRSRSGTLSSWPCSPVNMLQLSLIYFLVHQSGPWHAEDKVLSQHPRINVNVYCPSTVQTWMCLTEWGPMEGCIWASPSASIHLRTLQMWLLSSYLHDHPSKTMVLWSCLWTDGEALALSI